jgi:hypothetical protein
LDQAIQTLTRQTAPDQVPLQISFTHREEILYFAVLLGLGFDGKTLDPENVDINRHWKVTGIAPYLGHIGLENFRTTNGENRLRIISNGEVVGGFVANCPKMKRVDMLLKTFKNGCRARIKNGYRDMVR